MNPWKETLKQVAEDARLTNHGMRLGQYLYNIIRSSDRMKDYDYTTEGIDGENKRVGDILWFIEADELVKMMENFEKKFPSKPQKNVSPQKAAEKMNEIVDEIVKKHT